MHDILITDATIVDGTGNPRFRGSIAIEGDRIVSVGGVKGKARSIIEGGGLVASPGFVDPHSHADLTFLGCPLAENLIGQGVTTVVGGNCGISLAPLRDRRQFEEIARVWRLDVGLRWSSFGEWLASVEEEGVAVNYLPLVGHNTVRTAVMGDDFSGHAGPEQIDEMERLVREAMEEGAFGLSVGLDAAMTGHFAEREELVHLVRAAGTYGGLFAPHTRHHQNQWPAEGPDEIGYGVYHGPKGEIITGRYHGLREALEIAREAGGIGLHIAHLTPSYLLPQPHPEFLDEAMARATLLDIVDGPREEGMDVSFNAIAWSQSIGSELPVLKSFFSSHLLLPDWMRGMDREDFVRDLRNPSFRSSLRDVILSGKFKFGMLNPNTDPYWMDCYRIVSCRNEDYIGRTIGEIARERSPSNIFRAVYEMSFETVFDLLLDDRDATWALVVDKREAGVLPTFLAHERGMPCTDVPAFSADGSDPDAFYGYGVSPTAFGLFPHYIRRFTREERVLSLEEGIRKITSLPVRELFGVPDRGLIAKGMYADIVLFDYEALHEHSDFSRPTLAPEGIEWVIVNGTVVYERGRATGERPGRVLRRASARKSSGARR
jgi:N-acyl-D-amino-acid deacylase